MIIRAWTAPQITKEKDIFQTLPSSPTSSKDTVLQYRWSSFQCCLHQTSFPKSFGDFFLLVDVSPVMMLRRWAPPCVSWVAPRAPAPAIPKKAESQKRPFPACLCRINPGLPNLFANPQTESKFRKLVLLCLSWPHWCWCRSEKASFSWLSTWMIALVKLSSIHREKLSALSAMRNQFISGGKRIFLLICSFPLSAKCRTLLWVIDDDGSYLARPNHLSSVRVVHLYKQAQLSSRNKFIKCKWPSKHASLSLAS